MKKVNLSEQQEKILLYLYKKIERSNKGVPSSIIGETVGEAVKTNQQTQTRSSSWASPKCKSLKGSGLVEQLDDLSYRISPDGITYVQEHLINGYRHMSVLELLREFTSEVQSDMEEISDCVDHHVSEFKEENSWAAKIINWFKGLFK